jgi:serine/threonine protein kinase
MANNFIKKFADATKGVLAQTKTVIIANEHLPKRFANAVEDRKILLKDPGYGDYENSTVKFNY